MFTGIITAAWRGFTIERGKGFVELRLGFLSFAFVKGMLWQRHVDLLHEVNRLRAENQTLRERVGK